MVIENEHGKLYAVFYPQSSAWIIHGITVNESHRRCGYGTDLMEKALLRMRPYPILIYASNELGTDEKIVRQFFHKFGFIRLTNEHRKSFNLYPHMLNMWIPYKPQGGRT